MAKKKDYGDSEDLFADTRMSFGEHIEELRTHLWRAIVGFLICLVFSIAIGPSVLRFIAKPVEQELARFYNARAERIAKELNQGDSALELLNQPREFEMEMEGDDGQWTPRKVRIKPLDLALRTQE